MPSRNTIKQFEPDAAYHVYNRGVDKRIIFNDQRDYAVFLSFLKYALTPNESTEDYELDVSLISDSERFNLRRLNLFSEVDLLAYCLMPNHFHLLLYQHSVDGITKLMRSIATGYSAYFNKRYNRVGPLYQSRYKASRIDSESYWQHIARYIHLNPLDIKQDFKDYNYSSYQFYFNKHCPKWIRLQNTENNFSSLKEFEKFHEDYIPRRKELLDVKHMLANM